MAVQSVQQGLAEFKDELLAEYPFISPKLFQSELKLHLTIGMVYLLSESEVMKAKNLLDTKVKDMANQILGDLEQSNIQVKMKGIEIMNDDPYMTDIVYGKIEDPDELVQSKSGANRLWIYRGVTVLTLIREFWQKSKNLACDVTVETKKGKLYVQIECKFDYIRVLI